MPPGQECRSSRRFVAGHKPAKTFHTFSCGGFEIDWWQPGGFLRAAASGGRAGEAEWGRGGLHLQPDHGIQLTIVNNNNIKWSITTINKNNKLTIATVNNSQQHNKSNIRWKKTDREAGYALTLQLSDFQAETKVKWNHCNFRYKYSCNLSQIQIQIVLSQIYTSYSFIIPIPNLTFIKTSPNCQTYERWELLQCKA